MTRSRNHPIITCFEEGVFYAVALGIVGGVPNGLLHDFHAQDFLAPPSEAQSDGAGAAADIHHGRVRVHAGHVGGQVVQHLGAGAVDLEEGLPGKKIASDQESLTYCKVNDYPRIVPVGRC